jgi:hypothetical protein
MLKLPPPAALMVNVFAPEVSKLSNSPAIDSVLLAVTV